MKGLIELDVLITVKQLAGKLQISPYTLSRWVRESEIPYYRLNGKDIRFSVEDVEIWLKDKYRIPSTNSGTRPFQGKRPQQEDSAT